MKKFRLFLLFTFIAYIGLIPGCKLTLVEPNLPTVESFSPASGHMNDTIVVKGKNFFPNAPQLYTVSIGKTLISTFLVPDDKTLKFAVPEGIGTGNITVALGSGNASYTLPDPFVYQLTFSELQLFATGFNSPEGIDVDGNHNLVVADKGNHVIKLVSSTGSIPAIIAGTNLSAGGDKTGENNANGNLAKFNLPEDVAVDKQGNIYVADNNNYCIRKISNTTQRTVTTASGKIRESGTNDGKLLTARFYGPTGIAVAGDKNLLTVEYAKHSLRSINFNDSNVTTLINGMPALKYPNRVAYSEKRDPLYPIFIADKLNNRILQVNAAGVSNNSPIPFTAPHDLVIDEAGNIIVLTHEGNLGVYVIYKNKTVVQVIRTTSSFELKNPSGLAIDTDKKIIYLSDETLNRIAMATYR